MKKYIKPLIYLEEIYFDADVLSNASQPWKEDGLLDNETPFIPFP